MFVGPDDMDRHLGGQPGAEAGDSDEDEARDTYLQVGIRGDKHCVAHQSSSLFCQSVTYLVYTTECHVVCVILLAHITDIFFIIYEIFTFVREFYLESYA